MNEHIREYVCCYKMFGSSLICFRSSLKAPYDKNCFHAICCPKDFATTMKQIDELIKLYDGELVQSLPDDYAYSVPEKSIPSVIHSLRIFTEN